MHIMNTYIYTYIYIYMLTYAWVTGGIYRIWTVFGGWNLGNELLGIYHTELIVWWQNIKCGKTFIVVRIMVHGLAFWAIVGTEGPRRLIPDQMFIDGLAPWGRNWIHGPHMHIRKPIFVRGSITDATRIPKYAAQGLPNRVFFKDCGAQYLLFVSFSGKQQICNPLMPVLSKQLPKHPRHAPQWAQNTSP